MRNERWVTLQKEEARKSEGPIREINSGREKSGKKLVILWS